MRHVIALLRIYKSKVLRRIAIIVAIVGFAFLKPFSTNAWAAWLSIAGVSALVIQVLNAYVDKTYDSTLVRQSLNDFDSLKGRRGNAAAACLKYLDCSDKEHYWMKACESDPETKDIEDILDVFEDLGFFRLYKRICG